MMRMTIALPLLLLAACNVEKDEANDQTTITLDEQGIENAANDVGEAASDVASGVGNVAEGVGDAVSNEVGDIDVDVSRNAN